MFEVLKDVLVLVQLVQLALVTTALLQVSAQQAVVVALKVLLLEHAPALKQGCRPLSLLLLLLLWVVLNALWVEVEVVVVAAWMVLEAQ